MMENVLNLGRRSVLVDVVVPRYLAQVFEWLHKGRLPDLYQFLKQKSLLKHFDKIQVMKIENKTDPVNMDLTLLYKLLIHTCDITSENQQRCTSVKQGKEPSLKEVLVQLKHIRNAKSHNDPQKVKRVSEADLDGLANELTQLLTEMLTLAGREGGQCESVITKVISNMKVDVAKERGAEGGITVEQFVAYSRQELVDRQILDDSYLEPRLVVKTRDGLFGSDFPLSKLFTNTFRDGSQPKVIQIMGESGAGKTSLCKALMAWWLQKEPRVHGIGDYQLVLIVSCARVNSSDLHHHLRTWILPKTTAECDTANMIRLLGQTKILWLIDGWDEATSNGRRLLQELLHSKAESHTILATCRPEFSVSLADHFLGINVFNVSFAVLQEDERKELIRKMNLYDVDNMFLEKFFRNLHSFPPEEQQHLNNPLKLRLVAQLLYYGHVVEKGCRSLSLVYIYHFLINWQRRDLIKRCQAGACPGPDVAQKIDFWLRCLYKESFNSAKSYSSLILSGKSFKILSKECGVPTTLCLSTFLGCTPDIEALSTFSINAFSHATQRCVFAARHLDCCCEDAADAEAKLRTILEDDSSELDDHVDPYLGVYDLVIQFLLVIRILLSRVTCGWICDKVRQRDLYEAVLHLVRKFFHLVKCDHLPGDRWVHASSLKHRLAPVLLQVMEMWAKGLFQASVSPKFLVDMFASLLEGDGDPDRWLEVVGRCDDNGDLVKEVSQKISTKLWVINDGDMRAAVALLQHVTPVEVKVVVSSDPKKLPCLGELLSKLAERSVRLELQILTHFHVLGSKDFSDTYLELVCRRESKCLLNAFTGHLSNRGLSTLAAAHRLTSLTLRITQTLAVFELTILTPSLSCLKTLNLVYDNKKFVEPHSSLDGSLGVVVVKGIKSILTLNGLKNLMVHLQLPHLRDASVNTAVDFISGLSKRYVSLSVGKLDQKGVKNLIAGLNNNAVSVFDFKMHVYVKEYGRILVFSLGSLPIQVPVGDYLRALHDLLKDPLRIS